MRKVRRVNVPIRLCEVCAWGMVAKCASCHVQHCSETVIRESFHPGRSAARWRKPGRRENRLVRLALPEAPENGDLATPLDAEGPWASSGMDEPPCELDHCGSTSRRSASAPDEKRCSRVNAVIEDLPAYLEETSARLYELENNLCDVPKAKKQLSALKERHKKLQELLAGPIRARRAGSVGG